MAADAQTLLLVSMGIALVAAAFLLVEWQSLKERFLLNFALGFLCITVGCALAPLRQSGFVLVGIWLSNSMVPLAHLFFLYGAARLCDHTLARSWPLILLVSPAMTAAAYLVQGGSLPAHQIVSLFNAAIIAILCLKAAQILIALRDPGETDTALLIYTLLAHGGFYVAKSVSAFMPGAVIDLTRFSGSMVILSLLEGILVEVALAMSVAGALRRRREDAVKRLAERDPLTDLLNRRGFEAQANAMLADHAAHERGMLLLVDVDHFKVINDCFGHQEGDRLLVSLAAHLTDRGPAGSVIARLGGDEFALLVPRIDKQAGLRLARQLCAGFVAHSGSDGSGTLSIGCAPFHGGMTDLEKLQLQADRGLYDAKRKGRNQPGLIASHRQGGPLPFALSKAS